jgi:NADPH:quinone reductase-like Zn-dependent oxidoreductase
MTMRAVRFHAHGGPEVLQVDEIDSPEPGEGEVVLRMEACGLNRVDILSREGQTPAAIPFPHISGTEVAGEIIAIGPRVSGWELGQRVVVNPALSCGRCAPCREGHDNRCREGRIFGVQTPGGYAEEVLAPADHLIELPDGLDAAAAASITVTGSTAWHMLVERAKVGLGDAVLIIAAGSGIGVMGIQIAKMAGATVIATAGSDDKLRRAADLGADHVVNHRTPGWSKEVRSMTGRQGVDIVFEHVGAATWEDSLASLARGGRLVTCGGHSGFEVTVNLWHLFVKEQILMGSFAGTRRDVERVLALASKGDLDPVIHARFGLERAAEAQQLLEDRQVFGKVMLEA